MVTLTLTLTDEQHRQLEREALTRGVDVETYAAQKLDNEHPPTTNLQELIKQQGIKPFTTLAEFEGRWLRGQAADESDLQILAEQRERRDQTTSDMEELARQQGVKPFDLDARTTGWPEDESVDEFIETYRRWRREGG